MQHRLTLNLTYVNRCRLLSEPQISSTCPTKKIIWDTVIFYKITIICQFFLNSIVKPLITQLIAGHSLAVSFCVIYAERYLVCFIYFSCTKLDAVCVTPMFQTAQSPNSDQLLSVYRALSVTGQDNNLQSNQTAGTAGTMSGNEDNCCPLSLGYL